MATVHEVFEALRKAPTNSERGTKFEKLMVRYFELDPLLSSHYDRVWRWGDWPEHKGPDTGIDLVAREESTGELTAIQCKCYEPTHMLSRGDIDSFFTASGKIQYANRIIISTTDKWGSNSEAALDEQSKPVQRNGLGEIAASPVDRDIACPNEDLQVGLTPAVKPALRPHQQAAISML